VSLHTTFTDESVYRLEWSSWRSSQAKASSCIGRVNLCCTSWNRPRNRSLTPAFATFRFDRERWSKARNPVLATGPFLQGRIARRAPRPGNLGRSPQLRSPDPARTGSTVQRVADQIQASLTGWPLLYRTLGRTGLRISLASLGTGGPSQLGQQTHGDEAKAQQVIYRAIDLGINLFDIAANYGDSEAILGRALSNVSRDRYLLATKFSPYRPDGTVIPPQEVAESCEHSLRLLGVETIDLYQFHSVLLASYREVIDRLHPAVVRLRDQGKIRFVGITEYFFPDPAHEMLALALADDLWDTIMVKYGIMNFSAERNVLPMAKERNVGVLNMSPVRVKMTRPAELEKVIARWKKTGLIPPDALPDERPLDFLLHGPVESVVAAGYKFGAGHQAIATVLMLENRCLQRTPTASVLSSDIWPSRKETRRKRSIATPRTRSDNGC
jgi:L-galactose dehydrogenase